MTIRRYYQCDLCSNSLDPNQEQDGVGIYWTMLVKNRESLVFKPMREVEHHLCTRCLEDIKDAMQLVHKP